MFIYKSKENPKKNSYIKVQELEVFTTTFKIMNIDILTSLWIYMAAF